MIQFLLPVLGDVVRDVLRRVLPAEKISESERLRIETEVQTHLLDQDWKSIEAEYQDRSNARQLAQVDIARGNAFTGMLAAMVRPAWGFGALALVAAAVFNGYDIPNGIDDVLELVIIFFFGGRTIEKITPAIVSRFDPGKTGA
jgi:hypothetical protein